MSSNSQLAKLAVKRGVSMIQIADHLDQLPSATRRQQVQALGRRAQSALFEKAAAADPLTLDHFVPPHVAAQQQIIHHGRNTLPVFRCFEKRFCRPADDSSRLFGYNEGPTRSVIGPGYFVVYTTSGIQDWPQRGSVVIDYLQVPDAPVAPDWPRVVPNSTGGQRFIFDGTRDFMRRVSVHVSIGRAFKGDTRLPAYFALCRED